MAPALGGHGAGAAADEDDEIGRVDDGARLGRAAVAADDSGCEQAPFVDAALAADGGGDGRAEAVGQELQLRLGPGDDGAAAADEDGAGRRPQPRGRGFDCRLVRRRAAGGAAVQGRVGPDVALLHRVLLHIVGQAEMDGTRAPRRHLGEGRADGGRDRRGLVEDAVPL
jgi:hypothetical protein